MSERQRQREPLSEPWRLWDHIGVISGVVLGLVALVLVALIAVAPDGQGGMTIVVTVVIGVALIIVGGQLHGARRR